MYRLTIKGRPIGPEYESEELVIKAHRRLESVILELGWARCN